MLGTNTHVPASLSALMIAAGVAACAVPGVCARIPAAGLIWGFTKGSRAVAAVQVCLNRSNIFVAAVHAVIPALHDRLRPPHSLLQPLVSRDLLALLANS